MAVKKISQLIKKELLNTKGFSLIEIILSVAVFVLIATAIVGAFFYGQESSILFGNRIQAILLAEEGLEAVRNIRDYNFAGLLPGTYGLTIINGNYNLSGNSDIVDIFTRQITVSDIDANKKQVTSEVAWNQNQQRNGNISLTTYLTNWKETTSISDCSGTCQNLGYIEGFCRQNTQQCSKNGEVYESSGDTYCTEGASADTCCCVP